MNVAKARILYNPSPKKQLRSSLHQEMTGLTNRPLTMSPTQRKMLTNKYMYNNDKKDNVLRINKCSINQQYANINKYPSVHTISFLKKLCKITHVNTYMYRKPSQTRLSNFTAKNFLIVPRLSTEHRKNQKHKTFEFYA